MSHLQCPLCGLTRAINGWDPENYDLDIKVCSFLGLGYKKGFEKTGESSVLGDQDITPRIIDRILELLKHFINELIISPEIVRKRLNLALFSVEDIRSTLGKNRIDYQYRYLELREKIEKIEKEKKLEKEVDRICFNPCGEISNIKA